MIENIKIGMSRRSERVVTDKDTAAAYKTGGQEVFSTPAMIALMEESAFLLLKESPVGEDSVGTEMNIKHTRACGVGAKVYSIAKVEKIDGNKVVFSVSAGDEKGEIGCGTHTRYIIDPVRFMKKINGR
ncbi:MAG: thioesterase family protein [Bacteroidales bacterium]|jgi:fluoroacetyl-CoA thioesterase|nr:thioesterase family protein [Bacteroidales bacterium]MCI1733635.1 thioesterase family protein [Bacteroidales bacterium]